MTFNGSWGAKESQRWTVGFFSAFDIIVGDLLLFVIFPDLLTRQIFDEKEEEKKNENKTELGPSIIRIEYDGLRTGLI